MRMVVVIVSLLAMLASGFWAYRENYATKLSVREANRLTRDIRRLQEAIALQNAEWAYQNRPDRLAELVAANFDRLGLLPMQPEQFAKSSQLPMPPDPPPEDPLLVSEQPDMPGEILP
jgi:hypothetical protein